MVQVALAEDAAAVAVALVMRVVDMAVVAALVATRAALACSA